MQMEMFMKEIGLMIKHKEKENIFIVMDHAILGTGERINSMGKVRKHDLMVLHIRGGTRMEKNKEKECLNEQMEVYMKGSLKTII